MNKDRSELIEHIVSSLKENAAVKVIILFGPVAKGTEKPYSDIDIAVIADPLDNKMEDFISSHSSDIVDVVVFDRLPLYTQFEVLKHGEVLLNRGKKLFVEKKYLVISEYLDNLYFYKLFFGAGVARA